MPVTPLRPTTTLLAVGARQLLRPGARRPLLALANEAAHVDLALQGS